MTPAAFALRLACVIFGHVTAAGLDDRGWFQKCTLCQLEGVPRLAKRAVRG